MDADIFALALARFATGREWGRDPTKIRLAKRMVSKYQKILMKNAIGPAQVFKYWKRFGKGRGWKKLMIMYLMLSEDRTTFNFTGDFVRPWVGKLLDRDQQKEYNRKQEAKAAKDKAKAKPAVAKAKAQGKGQGQ